MARRNRIACIVYVSVRCEMRMVKRSPYSRCELRFCVVWSCKLERKSYVTAQGTFYSIHQSRSYPIDNQWKVFFRISVLLTSKLAFVITIIIIIITIIILLLLFLIVYWWLVHYSSRVLRYLVIQTIAVYIKFLCMWYERRKDNVFHLPSCTFLLLPLLLFFQTTIRSN